MKVKEFIKTCVSRKHISFIIDGERYRSGIPAEVMEKEILTWFMYSSDQLIEIDTVEYNKDTPNATELKVGDLVKVIGTTECAGSEAELIHIGTICEIIDTMEKEEGSDELIYEVTPVRILVDKITISDEIGFWYLAKDLEKGHVTWNKD